MHLLDLINLNFNAAICTIDLCPGSAFNSITAALTSQGYYKQADLLYYLTQSQLGSLASLIYAICAFAGIVSMVLGMPPRNYMWFFLGPAIYSFLVTSTYFAGGVRWMDLQKGLTPANQAEVWRIAEPGLRNNGYIIRNGITVNAKEPPSQAAQVSYFFVYIDYFFSSLMEQLIPLTGIYYLEEGQGAESNIDKLEGAAANKNWSILTDDKWSKVLDITDAHLSNLMIRRSFVDFLAGQCGDAYNGQIDNALWLAATKGRGERIPYSVFKGDKANASNANGADEENRALRLRNALSAQAIPIPESLVTLLVSGDGAATGGSFLESNQDTKNFLDQINSKNGQIFSGAITCDQYLRIIVHAFKYEAVNIYSQIIDDAPGEFRDDPKSVVRNLAYGWGIGKLTPPPNSNMGSDDLKRQEYFVNLILVYLFRNELMIAPGPSEGDTAANLSSERTQFHVDTQIRTVGSKTKYAEVYSWAKMMPYFQGIMMYVLAMAYPFVALMVIVPGWHKIIVTWITFWIWVKTWDLGFAIVKVLERSIWAMLGNDPSAAFMNQAVLNVGAFMKYDVGCNFPPPPTGVLGNCSLPLISFQGGAGGNGMDSMINTFKALGRALGLAGNLNLDLTNSYYIYIMSALYFAVPGVTGQIVLGAKSGAANLVGGAIQGFGDANKGAAGAGSQSHLANAVQANSATVGQASYAKASKGFAMDAIDSQNMASQAGLNSQALGTTTQVAQGVLGARERRNQSLASALSPAESAGSFGKAAAAMGLEAALGHGNGALGARVAELDADAAKMGGGSAPGATAGGRGGGAGGSAPGGAAVTGMAAAAKLAQQGSVNATTAALKNTQTQGYLAAANEVAAQSNDRTIEGFAQGAVQSRAQTQGQRMGGYANYRGETGAANASNNFANKIGAYSSIAAGTMGGSLVKPLPMANQDSAMSGILNSYTVNPNTGQAEIARDGQYASGGFFAVGGGFDKNVSGHLGRMNTMNGDAVRSTYGPAFGGAHGTDGVDLGRALKSGVFAGKP